MSTFRNAVRNQEARTENGMKALASTSNPHVDLFFKIGASRGQNIIPVFSAAFASDKELALRIALWARDVRGGSGERKIFRDILSYLESVDKDAATLLLRKTPLVGRWDDVLTVSDADLKNYVFGMVKEALEAKNGLAAKWMPRKGPLSVELRNFLGYSPKRYRKTLVSLTNVVEQKMCAKQWDEINFSHVPSVAAKNYRKAFFRNTPKYKEYVEALKTGKTVDGKEVKINASAIFPHDVIRDYMQYNPYGTRRVSDQTIRDVMIQQWNALPNYIQGKNILAMVDVSGSMTSPPVDKSGLLPLTVAVSLGLYCADKNVGKFKDMFLTFSGSPKLLELHGDVADKIDQMSRAEWQQNTNLHAAFEKILKVAKDNSVPQEEMPEMLLILSDMQFDSCIRFDHSAYEMIRHKYEQAGYTMPAIVFWNLVAHDNVPVKMNQSGGTALISGFSPAILKSVLSGSTEEFTPYGIMMKTIMNQRYDLS